MNIFENLRKDQGKPLLFAAPICGFSRFPYRKILNLFPVDLIFTEMISVDALYYKNPKTFELLVHDPDLKVPTGVQLVGSKIDLFLNAAEKLRELKFACIDINLGCPVKKVLKNKAGSYLLQEPEKIYRIFKSLSEAFPDIAFTGKIRLGMNQESLTYMEVAKAVEEGGAQFITVHGRTRSQMYEGDINYQAIAEIKKSSGIPVIGNGNIFKPEDAKKMLELTQCDGLMLARGMLGNPWLFQEIKEFFNTGKYTKPRYKDKVELLSQNFQLEQDFDPRNGFREFKKIGVKYLKNMPMASEWRNRLLMTKSHEEMKELTKNMLEAIDIREKETQE